MLFEAISLFLIVIPPSMEARRGSQKQFLPS
jgi:hypothetical protein